MKKQIALIIISMLAAMSVSAQNVNQNEMCSYSQRTPICEMGPGVIQPDLDEIFGTCPEVPDLDVKPEIPEKPEVPEVPEIPETPETPDIDIPDVPDEPILPEQPEKPEQPDEEPDTENEIPDTSYAAQVLRLVNAERARYGLSPLTYDVSLGRAADIRAVEIKKLFSHTRPNGTSCFTVLDEIGYSYRGAGENIAYGQRSPEEVMTAWMNSEGHRANILGENYTHIGIGVYESGGVIYWSQMFSY